MGTHTVWRAKPIPTNWRPLAILAATILPGQLCYGSEFTYVFDGGAVALGTQYEGGVLRLSSDAGVLTGQAIFPDRQPIDIRGKTLSSKLIELTFDAAPPADGSKADQAFEPRAHTEGWATTEYFDAPFTRVYELSLTDQFERWVPVHQDATDEEAVLDEDVAYGPVVPSFIRLRRGSFDESGLVLSRRDCGVGHGSVQLELVEGATWDSVKASLHSQPFFTSSKDEDGRTLFESLQDVLQEPGDFRDTILVEGAVEVELVKRLRENPKVLFADVGPIGCAFGDEARLVVSRDVYFTDGSADDRKFLRFVETGLRNWLDKSVHQFRLEEPLLKRARAKPHDPVVLFRVVAASDFTRGTPNEWDQFTVGFQHRIDVENSTEDASVLISVDDLSTSQRSSGSQRPPGREYFQTEQDLYAEEAIIGGVIIDNFEGEAGAIFCDYYVFGMTEESPQFCN